MGPRLFIAEDNVMGEEAMVQKVLQWGRDYSSRKTVGCHTSPVNLRASMGPRLFIAEDSRSRNGLCERQLQCVLRARVRNRWRRVAENRLDES